MSSLKLSLLASSLMLISGAIANHADAQSPQATPPYTLSIFASAPAGLSAPDSIAVIGPRVFVGYGNGHKPDGSDGLNSQIVEYAANGKIAHIYTVPGHNDGLKVEPTTQHLWALQNEDGNTNLVIIDPTTQGQHQYKFTSFPHGGGYDDIVFLHCKVFVSASNPANNPNTGPAIVEAKVTGDSVDVTPFVQGNASATDIPFGMSMTLNLQDPDSMTLDPLGDIVLDSQADQELVIISNPGYKSQRVLHLPLTYATANGPLPVEIDDTAFATSSQGAILFADKGANTVYMLTTPAFAPGSAYSAADGASLVGSLDITSGVITPIVTGLNAPGGLVFVDMSGNMPKPGQACQ